MQKMPERSLLDFVIAGALGSMLGTLFMETVRGTDKGKEPITRWVVLAVLVITYSYFGHHPLTRKGLARAQHPSMKAEPQAQVSVATQAA